MAAITDTKQLPLDLKLSLTSLFSREQRASLTSSEPEKSLGWDLARERRESQATASGFALLARKAFTAPHRSPYNQNDNEEVGINSEAWTISYVD